MRLNACVDPALRGALIALCAIVAAPAQALGLDISGYAGFEARLFPHAPRQPEQATQQFSALARPEIYYEWDDARQSVLFVPFARLDSADPRRTHADVRELFWQRVGEDWELRVGIGRVFWGVTESRHLVDIINQTDAIEDVDGEDKLGQPMVNLALIRDWGTVDLFVMPWFRERTFAGTHGRLRPAVKIATEASYESNLGRHNPDVAVRWSHALGDWDLGVAHFYGTSREAEFEPVFGPRVSELRPRYKLIHQTSIDAQLTTDAWLWKLEAIRRSGQGKPYVAVAAGFEYTFFGVFDSAADVGVLGEYLYDQRGQDASTPFQDDLFAGFRLALNDEQSTELLAGVIVDRELKSQVFSVEASRRLGDAWKIELNGRFWSNIDRRDPQFAIRDDDHIQLTVLRYF